MKTVYGFADYLGGEDDIKFDNTSEEDITGRECPYHVLSLAEDVVHIVYHGVGLGTVICFHLHRNHFE